MKSSILLAAAFLAASNCLLAQRPTKPTVAVTPTSITKTDVVAPTRSISAESSVITHNTVTIKGQLVPYKATTGTLPV